MTRDYYEKIKRCSTMDPASDCWIWQHAIHRQGYGLIRQGRTMKTIQRAMAIEHLKWDIGFNDRIGNTCQNLLCANPDHLLCLSHTEVMYRRYKRHGSGGKFDLASARNLRDEYNEMKRNKVHRTINILAEKYDCSTSVLYRTIDRANGKRVLACDEGL